MEEKSPEDLPNESGNVNSPESSPLAAAEWHKCRECDLNFISANSLRTHQQRVHEGITKFHCSSCDYGTLNKSDLKKHLLVHTRETPYKCDVCVYECKTSSALKLHQRGHSKEKPHKCDNCEATFTQVGGLRSHNQKFHGGFPTRFKCSTCGYVTSNQSRLEKHFLVHTEGKLFKCTVCDFSCKSSSSLKKHRLCHSIERPSYKCDTFDANLSSKKHLEENQRSNTEEGYLSGDTQPSSHEEVISNKKETQLPGQEEVYFTKKSQLSEYQEDYPTKNVKLVVEEEVYPTEDIQLPVAYEEVCVTEDIQHSVHEEIYTSEASQESFHDETSVYPNVEENLSVIEDLPNPLRDENSPESSSFRTTIRHKCRDCELNFTSAYSLKRHQLTVHKGVTKFHCSSCDYGTSNKPDLKKHLLVHTRETPYKCDVCVYECKTSSALKLHQLVHSKEKPHKCDNCEATFTQVGGLRSHNQKFHGGFPTRFKCSTCGYVTSNQSRLEKHFLVHTEGKLFKCTVCDFSCKSSSSLKKHRLRHSIERPSYKCDTFDANLSSKKHLEENQR